MRIAEKTIGVAGVAALREAGLTVVRMEDIERICESLPSPKSEDASTTGEEDRPATESTQPTN